MQTIARRGPESRSARQVEPRGTHREAATPAKDQHTGMSASTRLLDALVGSALTGRGEWRLRLRCHGPHSTEQTRFLKDVRDLSVVLPEMSGEESKGAVRVEAQIHPHAPGAFRTPGCDSFHAATCLSVGVHLPRLFSRGEPLFDPALLGADGHVLPGALGAGGMQRARRFAVDHARHLVFTPSAALASYDTLYLFFLLKQPRSMLERDKDLIERVQGQLAQLVHGAYPRKIGSWIPLPMLQSTGGKRIASSRLLWARGDVVHSLERLDAWTRAVGPDREVSAIAGSSGKQAPGGAPEMRLRTLMDDYELADLDLPPALRQLVAAGSCSGQIMVLDELPLLVEAMACARYGFEDVRLVVADSRFPLSFSARIGPAHKQGLALRFRNALRAASTAHPVRLPYGITRIRLLSDGDDRTADRYVVEGGTKRAPFQLEVSHDVFISARRFHRALASHLRSFPYRVLQEVWEQVVLRRGLRDPRVRLRPRARPEKAEVPLAERIARFASEAKPLEFGFWESGDPIPWPVLRDGQVVFRLAALREQLAREINGPVPRRGEVTAAVRAAGGAPFGAMRFGKQVIRVWTLPYPGRSQAPAPGRGGAPA